MKHFKKIKPMIPILFFVACLMLSLPLMASANANLSISMRDSPDPVQTGQTLTYTITVTNNGPDDALGIVVRDILPAGVIAVGSSGCFNDPNGTTNCNLGAIIPGGFAQFTIEVTVRADTFGIIINEATVSSNTPDPNSFDNTVTEQTTVNLLGVVEFKWAFSTGNILGSSPAIGTDGTIYVGSYDGNLYAINPDGSQKWAFSTGDYVFSSPAIGSDGTIYVGSSDNNLYAINPDDGSEKWTFSTGGIVVSSPAIGTDGTIYVGSYDNNLYAISVDSGGLARSPWPMFHQNLKHTGRVKRLSMPGILLLLPGE